jgi:hypothetical protein
MDGVVVFCAIFGPIRPNLTDMHGLLSSFIWFKNRCDFAQ